MKVLFLLGADDGSLPQVGAAPGLLSDDDRALLAGYGLACPPSGGTAFPSPRRRPGPAGLPGRKSRAVERYVLEELGGLEGQSARFQYLFRRLLRSVQAVVDNVAEELLPSQG